jgi:hypothetical protein
MLPSARTRAASATSMIRFRFHRSTSAPAKSWNTRKGTVSAKPTIPALAGECVSASTSSGNAIIVIRVPIADTACPLHRSMKSRFRQSGPSAGNVVGDGIIGAAMPLSLLDAREQREVTRVSTPGALCRLLRGRRQRPRRSTRPWLTTLPVRASRCSPRTMLTLSKLHPSSVAQAALDGVRDRVTRRKSRSERANREQDQRRLLTLCRQPRYRKASSRCRNLRRLLAESGGGSCRRRAESD